MFFFSFFRVLFSWVFFCRRYDLRWSPTRLIPFYGGAAYHDYHHRNGAKCFSNFAHGFALFDTIYGTNKVLLTIGFFASKGKKPKNKGILF